MNLVIILPLYQLNRRSDISLITRVVTKSDIKFKVATELFDELEHLKLQAQELGLNLNLDAAFEQNLRKLVHKIKSEMTQFTATN